MWFLSREVSNLNYAVDLSYSYHIHMIMINTNINYRTISYKNRVKRGRNTTKPHIYITLKKIITKMGDSKRTKK
jgi:hypothetical protein